MTIDLRLGDCLVEMPKLAAASADAVIADIPYGTTACAWDTVIPFEPMWAQLKRIAKPRAAIVLFGSQPFTSALVMSNPKMFRYEWIWEKDKASNFAAAKYRALKYHDNICIFSQETERFIPQMWEAGFRSGKAGKNGGMSANGRGDVYGRHSRLNPIDRNATNRYPKSIIKIASLKHNCDEYAEHPTQKPVALMEYLIRTYTNEGDTVLDFTMGSGTTLVACVRTGRNGIGIENDAHYFAIAEKRIAEAQLQMVMPL